MVTDCDFEGNIVLIPNDANQAQKFFNDVERIAKKVRLHINGKKSKFLPLNQPVPEITTTEDNNIECVDAYKYLGSWIGSTEKDMSIKKARVESVIQIITNMELMITVVVQGRSF